MDDVREMLRRSAAAGEYRSGVRGLACTPATFQQLRNAIERAEDSDPAVVDIARRSGVWHGSAFVGTPVVVVESAAECPQGYTWLEPEALRTDA